MASTFTTSFGIEKIGTGEQAGAWGTTTNHNADILDRIASYKSVGLSGTTHTLTVREASPGAGTENLQDGMYRVIKFTGALGANNTVTIAPNTSAAWFIIENATTDSGSSGPYSVILTQGSGANVTLQNGKNAIVYCDGAGSGAVIYNALNDLQMATLEVTGAGAVDGALTVGGTTTVVALTASGLVTAGAKIDMNGTELILDADADTSITADTDDQIDIRIAGADDFQFTANTFTAQSGSTIAAQALTATTVTASAIVTANAKLDLNGTELILDVDADTSITADTDDTIDVRIAGADDFQFTANDFTALSGSVISTNTIAETTAASGVTIDGLLIKDGALSDLVLPAVSGIIEANANFIDMCLVGPSIDGQSWNGKFSNGSVWTSLMLATVETSGSDVQLNIWDLTAGTLTGATPLATLTLSGATSTSIAASMGYLIVGTSDQGIHIVDPHDGAWAERTNGWPRTLSTSTAPALDSNDVSMVAAKVVDSSGFDARTGGSIPTFGALFAAGETKTASLIKTDGNVWDITGESPATGVVGFQGNDFIFPRSATDTRRFEVNLINADVASSSGDSYNDSASYPAGFATTTAFSASGMKSAWASTSGTSFKLRGDNVYASSGASINRTYNTGYLLGDIRGAWLANSVTADRSYQANTLTQNGTVTEAVVASGAELKQYSGFSSSNYLAVGSNADWDVIGTGSATSYGWARYISGDDGMLWGFGNSGNTIRFHVMAVSNGTINIVDDGATAAVSVNSGNVLFTDGAWHHIAFVRVSSTERHLYVDGVLRNSSTTDAGSLSSSGNLPWNIGIQQDNSTNPANATAVSLVRFTKDAMTATMVRQIYDAEAPMYLANAKVLLQSGSTDIVLDAEVDPLTKKVIVTQTDSQEIFNGLAIETERTVATGGSTFEHGAIFGDAVAEINNANLFASTPATDQRQVNEMVRSLSADLPAGIDLGKAKAYYEDIGKTSVSIATSYNIKSIARDSTGVWTITFAIPFKTDDYISAVSANGDVVFGIADNKTTGSVKIKWYNSSGAAADARGTAVFFGELENE